MAHPADERPIERMNVPTTHLDTAQEIDGCGGVEPARLLARALRHHRWYHLLMEDALQLRTRLGLELGEARVEVE